MSQSVFRGDRMQEARKALGMNQQQLAKELGITRTQVSNMERGGSEPSMRVLALTAYILAVSADWLIDLSEASRITINTAPPIPFEELP